MGTNTLPAVLPYEVRAQSHKSALARRLLETMARKRSNLCLSADVTTKEALIRIVKLCAPFIVIVKTHIDIVSDFDEDLSTELKWICRAHDILIFEDRKFADIGNTVQLQYTQGVHKIAQWADIVNAHALPGDGIVKGLEEAAKKTTKEDRGLLLIAELSSQGSLAKGQYTKDVVSMARRYPDFVFGFIAGRRVQDDDAMTSADEDMLILTPGVGLHSAQDGKGQQYRTPEEVVVNYGADVIIVGRGIYGGGASGHSDDNLIIEEAKRYRDAGWSAYEKRLADGSQR